MCSMSTYFLLKTPDLSEDAGVAVSLPALLKGWFLAVAVVTALWGLALFATDDGASELVWAWPGDLLSSRLIASMLLTIAATAVYGVLYPRTATMALAVIATYGIAGALANVWQDFLDKPVKEGYVVVLGVMGVVSLVTLFVRTVQSPRDAEPQPSAAD
jgi:hypothetical protein